MKSLLSTSDSNIINRYNLASYILIKAGIYIKKKDMLWK